MNQCDGCRAGVPVDGNGCHRMGPPGGLMACTADRYAPSAGEFVERKIQPLVVLTPEEYAQRIAQTRAEVLREAAEEALSWPGNFDSIGLFRAILDLAKKEGGA